MKLYTSIGPNPRVVRMFMAEKGIDGLIAGRPFIVGDKLTLADILPFCFLEFGASAGRPFATSNKNVVALLDRMRQRPSAATS